MCLKFLIGDSGSRRQFESMSLQMKEGSIHPRKKQKPTPRKINMFSWKGTISEGKDRLLTMIFQGVGEPLFFAEHTILL